MKDKLENITDWLAIEKAKKAAVDVLLHNADGPFRERQDGDTRNPTPGI